MTKDKEHKVGEYIPMLKQKQNPYYLATHMGEGWQDGFDGKPVRSTFDGYKLGYVEGNTARKALAQSEQTTGNILMDSYKAMQSMKVEGPRHVVCQCDKCKAQPEQEPVAFASHGVVNWIADKQFQHEALLYSAPQRTWVGLTDEEIAEVEDEFIVDYRIPAGSAWNFARAIEAKLKEKNT